MIAVIADIGRAKATAPLPDHPACEMNLWGQEQSLGPPITAISHPLPPALIPMIPMPIGSMYFTQRVRKCIISRSRPSLSFQSQTHDGFRKEKP